MSPRISWEGVFPAVTTQFHHDLSLNIDATAKVMDGLIRDGVSGLIVCGTVGENTSLTRKEKIAIMEAAKSVAARPRARAVRHRRVHDRVRRRNRQGGRARRHRRRHGDARARLFLQAARDRRAFPLASQRRPTCRSWSTTTRRSTRTTSRRTSSPRSRTVETMVCFKDSSGDTRRFIDMRNMVGDRFVLFAGLDDVIVESVMVGAVGWVSGMSNAFPREGETLFRLASAGRYRRGHAALRMVHAAAAPRCPSGPRPVHQALRAHHGPRHRS